MADDTLDQEQKFCGTTTHKGDVTITPGLSELEQASDVSGVHVKEVKHVRPVEEQTGVTSSQNSDSSSESNASTVLEAQSQLHDKGTEEQSTTVIDSQGLGLDQTSNQGFKTGGKEMGLKVIIKKGDVPSSCSPQALSTFLPTVSSYEKADSRDHRTSGETTKNHENDSLVQSDTALSNEEPVREDEQSSSVSSKMSRVEVDDDSVKETKIAAVETLLQLSSRETLYSVREGEANEQSEQTGATSIVSSVQSADVINHVINMHEPLKQLCNKTVWDNSCPSSAVGLLSDCNNSSLASLRNESRDQMQLSDSVCESSASNCRDGTFATKSGNENFELCVESENKHEDALVNSDLPNQRITTQNNSHSDTGLEERLVSHGRDESETKESQENIEDNVNPCTDTREVRKNDGGVHLQENISTSEMDTEKGITLEADCENVMCNDTNVCENNSSMVDAVKGSAQTLDESKQSLPGSYLTEVSDEDQIVKEREEISCPKDEKIVEVGNELNYLGVTREKTNKVEVMDLKCDKVKGSKQCQDSNEMDIGQEVGRDETEASKSVILTHPVVTAKSDDKVESMNLLQDDNNKMEIQEVVKDKAEADKSFKLTHREETTPTGEKNLLPQIGMLATK
ncbi:hypothetical protein BSL78_05192 [Apostichopus japonicus]|uniref:Uncharacterized protein n=1 Tax=Stichopus japonicus TaxID=307972 RepID=A0A2G8LCD5_STIJA|nr:hypothetical protein BSL78_05192 [Apostichopus japonicus]